MNRREFLSATCRAALLGPPTLVAGLNGPRYISPPDVHIGYAAITWHGRDLEAIADISAAGYEGIQLRSPIVAEYAQKTGALREELAKHRLTLVALSSGNLRIDPAVEADELALHARHAAFVREVGGLFLQVIDEKPKNRPVTASDYPRVGRLLTTLGRRTADVGIPLGYHHHMNSIGERPDEIERIVEATDPRYVKLVFDIAHYQQGGGDPVRAIRQYADRILFVHLKDVESSVRDDPSRSYRFVELGRGTVDVKGCWDALGAIGFGGWVVVELDAVPDAARTPKESALLNKKYLETRLGLRVGSPAR